MPTSDEPVLLSSQKMSKCAGSSVFNVTIFCFSLSFVNEMKDLGLLVGQKTLFHPRWRHVIGTSYILS